MISYIIAASSFFAYSFHGNDAGLHGARAERELDDIVHLHIVGSAGNLAVDGDSTGVAGFVCHGVQLDNAEIFKYLSSLMFKLLFFNIWRHKAAYNRRTDPLRDPFHHKLFAKITY